ncbi:MAG: hypothetical protein AAB551_00525, partial [Patescibacteria group bacterium]
KEENFGQDLYLKMYQSKVYAPDVAVTHEMAQAYGLSLHDMENVLNGSVTPLLQSKKYSKTFSQDQAFTMAYNIQKTFSEKLAIANLKSEFDSQTVPTEIFANGDLSDSGFDLLSDLDIIEYYLFVDKTPNAVNKTLPPGKTKPSKNSPPKISQSQQTSFPENGHSRLLAANSIFDSGFNVIASASSPASLTVNPFTQQTQCVVPNAVDTAITNYHNQPGNGEKPGNKPSGTNSLSSSGSSGSDSNSSGMNGTFSNGDASDGAPGQDVPADSAPDNDPFINPPELETTPVSPATSDFPMDPSLCGDFSDSTVVYHKEFSTNANNKAFASFCFLISEKMRNYSSFYPQKPCINCTISAMNQAFKETVSHSLIPSKLTGNIFESAKCKDGVNLSNLLDLNIFIVPMPILTPPKYGAYEGRDITREFDLFAKKYLPLSQAQKDQKKSDDPAAEILHETEDELLEKQATSQCLSYGSTDMTQVDLLNCVNEIVASEKGKTASSVSEQSDQVELQVSSELYQPVAQELEQMRTFFQIFKNTFSEIQTGKNYCPALNSKPVK